MKSNSYSFEKIFSPVFSRDFVTVDWLVHNINAKEKIGYEGDYQNNEICNFNLYFRRNSGKLHPLENECWRCIYEISVENVLNKTMYLIESSQNHNSTFAL